MLDKIWDAITSFVDVPDHKQDEMKAAIQKVLENRAENYHAISNMQRGADTYRVRNKRYGNNYKRFGQIMMALYPDGITINSFDQWNRMGVIHMIIAKMSRYVTNPTKGHPDSAHDMAVYSFMLEELDAEIEGLNVSPPQPLVTTVPAPYVPDCSVGARNLCEHVYVYPCSTQHPARQCKPPGLGAVVLHNCGKPSCLSCGDRRES